MKQYTDILLSDNFLIIKGAFIFLIGPLNTQIAYLLLVIFIDMYFGVRLAINKNEFKFSIFYKKVTQKIIVYAGWIAIFNAMDIVIGLPSVARASIIILLLFMEVLSAIRNTRDLGFEKLSDAISNILKSFVSKDPKIAKIIGEEAKEKLLEEEELKGGEKDERKSDEPIRKE